MKCLRCGHCCINYDVMIVVDQKKGPVEDNVRHKKSGERCPHLVGFEPGRFICMVHSEEWYGETPCFEFGQVEAHETDECRMGVYMLKEKKGGKQDAAINQAGR